ncbi:MAG: ABC transporter ATP-binding protein [Candidatus Thorarchaeota archaeon]|nr:MAG: ABC transporter ATP-binding protein [Candidatus Thorarchaeota archaeon]
MSSAQVQIVTQGLSKNFGPIEALKNLDLEVKKGSTFGFLGPNGAGKTTTVRILSGLLRPSSGNAAVCGFDVLTQQDEIKGATGLLPETPGLYSKLSAVEFLEFIGALNDLTGEIVNKRIDQLLALLGLEGRQNDLLESYSSGMKQKVLVASTILHDPTLVFLDEPTSRLDPSASALVKEIILALAKETETTFFICTHMTDFAEDVCDIIGILNEGVLSALGSPNEIIDQVGANDLEDAYLKIVGGEVDREKLLTWRQ